MPSMVVTFDPSACQANIVQDFRASPSTCTTQAPHCDVSHPTCVPVRRRFSRRYCTKSVRGSTSAVTALPFTVIETAGMLNLPNTRSFSTQPGNPVGQREINPYRYYTFRPLCNK